jgi:hypothetical protein
MIGPREIAGVAAGLGEGFTALGWRVGVLDVDGHPFGYSDRSANYNAQVFVWLNRLTRWTRGLTSNFLGKLVHATARSLAGIVGLSVGLLRYNYFIFLFGHSFLPWNLDLLLLRLVGKKTLMIYCGSDSRPCYLNGGWLHRMETIAQGDFPMLAIVQRNRDQLTQLRRVSKRVNYIVDHPLSAHLQERNCVSWLWVGLPTARVQDPLPLPMGKLKVLHAPSTSFGKGTEIVRTVVAELSAADCDFEYQEISGMSNAAVLEAIRDCHIVIDELFSDIGLAGLGCEAAAQGRVVVVGGYGWAFLDRVVPPGGEFPSVQVTQETLFDRMKALLTMPRKELQALADAHRAFIDTKWSAELVAARYATVLQGGVPNEAMFDPGAIDYAWGVGTSPAVILEGMRKIAKEKGEDFLVPAARKALAQHPAKPDDITLL